MTVQSQLYSCFRFLFVFYSMAIKGYRSPLENKDLWSLNKQDSSVLVVPNLLNEWEVEKSKTQRCEFKQIFISSVARFHNHCHIIKVVNAISSFAINSRHLSR